MKRLLAAAAALLLLWLAGDAQTLRDVPAKNKNIGAPSSGFPKTVQVRLWYLHPPASLKLRADAGQARVRKCATCNQTPVTALGLRAVKSRIEVDGDKATATELHIAGTYSMSSGNEPPIKADFQVDVKAEAGHLLITATMPMDEYIAGVLAGEVGNFQSDEALKAMAVAARTYAMHFGSRHAQEGFDLCDTTHCQDLRIAGIDARLRKIASDISGEILWYEGEPAATYYHANCGGTTEDGRYTLGNDEPPAPYLKQHSDTYCVRNGVLQWRSSVTKRELQSALQADGIDVPGRLRAVAITQRTPSGRVELVRVTGSGSATVPALAFRFAIGRHIGWERLKSNWYEVSVTDDSIVFRGRGSGHGVGLCQAGAEVMGSEGKGYREILAYYYPGTKLGIAAQGANWQALANADIELLTTRPEADNALLPVATRLLHEAEESTGFVYKARPRLKVFPTVAMFRNTTGEPGWVAATTRGRTIQMQPPEMLRQAGTLESTLRHELLHMLIESYAKAGTPVWFREGLVLYLAEPNVAAPGGEFANVSALEKAMRDPASETQLRQAYAAARARVALLVEQNGKETVLRWVQEGSCQLSEASCQ